MASSFRNEHREKVQRAWELDCDSVDERFKEGQRFRCEVKGLGWAAQSTAHVDAIGNLPVMEYPAELQLSEVSVTTTMRISNMVRCPMLMRRLSDTYSQVSVPIK
jgi:hypothetical protein